MINNVIKVQLAQERYDRCKDCPLCGLLPENERPSAEHKHGCLALMVAITDAEFEGKSQTRKCDGRWKSLTNLPKRIVEIPLFAYQKYRVPFETPKK